MLDMLNHVEAEKVYSDFCILCDKEIALSKVIFHKVCVDYIRRRFMNVIIDSSVLECEIFAKKELLGRRMPRTVEQVIYIIGRGAFTDKIMACDLFPEL